MFFQPYLIQGRTGEQTAATIEPATLEDLQATTGDPV